MVFGGASVGVQGNVQNRKNTATRGVSADGQESNRKSVICLMMRSSTFTWESLA